jgi:hypothetical protein
LAAVAVAAENKVVAVVLADIVVLGTLKLQAQEVLLNLI